MVRTRKTGKAKTTIELPSGLHTKLRLKAALEDRSINDIMVDCTQECLADFRLDPDALEVETVEREGTPREGAADAGAGKGGDRGA
jgi:hypothetical protein